MKENDLHHRLKDLPLSEIRFFKSLKSTNDYAIEWLNSGAHHLSLVIAEDQTAGRGRMDRKWYSTPKESLTFSLILKPNPQMAEQCSLYSPLGAIAVCKAIEENYNLEVEIKWPNDVLINGKKICGVLAEVIWNENLISGLILGIGINLSKKTFPDNCDLLFPASSLSDFIKEHIDPLQLLNCVLHQLIDWEQKLGSDIFLSYWQKHLAYKDEDIRIIQNGLPTVNGRLLGVAKDGSLRIELDTGLVKLITIGDVHLRSGGG